MGPMPYCGGGPPGPLGPMGSGIMRPPGPSSAPTRLSKGEAVARRSMSTASGGGAAPISEPVWGSDVETIDNQQTYRIFKNCSQVKSINMK